MSIENMNYWNDSRVQAAMKRSEDYEEVDGVVYRVLGCEEDNNRLLLPCKVKDCYTCSGKGTHVNPSIDAGGLGREDFDEDPGFEEDYFSGVHDVTCYECRGVKKVLTVDYAKLNDAAKKRWNQHCKDEAYDRAVEAGERAMGA